MFIAQEMGRKDEMNMFQSQLLWYKEYYVIRIVILLLLTYS